MNGIAANFGRDAAPSGSQDSGADAPSQGEWRVSPTLVRTHIYEIQCLADFGLKSVIGFNP